MADDILLNGVAGPVGGTYFLLLDPPEAEDDESVLASALRVGNALEITPLSELDEIVSIETLPGEGFEGAIVCALTADGTLMLSDGVRLWTEVVPNESAYEDGHRVLRRLRTVRFLNGVLYVAGFGGQVYRRGSGEAWQDISFEVPELVGGHALFYHVVSDSRGTPIFGGIFLHERELTEAMRAALDASDGDLYRKLKRATKKADHMLVAEYRDGWRTLFTDHPGVVSWLSPRKGGGFYLVSQTGVVWETSDFQSLAERSVPDSPAAFNDIKNHAGEPLFLRSGQLWRLGPEGLAEFEPPLPAASSAMGLWGGTDELISVHRDALWSLDGEAWVRLELRLV